MSVDTDRYALGIGIGLFFFYLCDVGLPPTIPGKDVFTQGCSIH